MYCNQHPWNKDRLLGQKPPLKPKEIWSLRIRLQLAGKVRDLAMFNLALDSKLRGCDLVSLRVRDVQQGSVVAARGMVMQRKTQRPVQFEITEATREAISAWLACAQLQSVDYLFPGPQHRHVPISPTVRPDRQSLGTMHRAGSDSLRNAFAPSDQSHPYLSPDEEHQGDPASSWSYSA